VSDAKVIGATDYAIEMDGLTRRFGDFVAVDRVTLKIPKGQLYGFLGLNGAGKTTTIRMLTTLLPPSAGTAKLWGHDVMKEPLAARKLVGLVSDETSESQSAWTAREYLSYFARIRHMRNPEEEVERNLDDVGLDANFRGKLIRTYSTGMKRRVEIARRSWVVPKSSSWTNPLGGWTCRRSAICGAFCADSRPRRASRRFSVAMTRKKSAPCAVRSV
jgi:ABC-2 type transport system ATP-binding protein